jgi:hypothetical protein
VGKEKCKAPVAVDGRGRATHVSARSLVLSTLITGLDGRSNFERNGGAFAPSSTLPPLAHCYGQKPAGDPNSGSSQKNSVWIGWNQIRACDNFGPSASPWHQPHSRHHARNSSRNLHVGFDLRRQAVGIERLRDQARRMHGPR